MASPFGRRRRALSSKKTAPAPRSKPLTVANRTPTSKDTSKHTTRPSKPLPPCNDRLHLVLSRRTKLELSELALELRAHANVKTVCVYTDSPLVSSAPLSKRQMKALLMGASQVCTQMTCLQLDFSSEFALDTLNMPLDCDLLATLLQNAPQLESLLLKDVPLQGSATLLRSVLSNHPQLHTLEFKWCTCSDMPRMIATLAEMPHLVDLTLLVSSAHDLPLPRLAASSSLRRLTLGLEQRHINATTAYSMDHRHQEQALLLQFLEALRFGNKLQECTLFSHHWKSHSFVPAVIEIVRRSQSLTNFSCTDYNYGSDDPCQLNELALALKDNKHLRSFKLVSKKRVSSSMDRDVRRTNMATVQQAFVDMLLSNTTLHHLEIGHAGIHLSDCGKHRKRVIPFYLMTNRLNARPLFLHRQPSANAWFRFVALHHDNTPLLLYLFQENPMLLELLITRRTLPNDNKLMWELYF